MGLADQVMKLAADAARLAGALLPQRDMMREVIERMQHHDVSVTHADHALFTSFATAFSGPDPFHPEELILRARDGTLELDLPGRIRWLAFSTGIPVGRDLILTVNLDTSESSAVNAFIRCWNGGGEPADGPRAMLGYGHVDTDRYVHHPVIDITDCTSQLIITFDLFSHASIRKVALAFATR